jgi:peroxiredoxin
LADYRERYLEIRLAGADVAAVSVDAPDKSEGLRVRLSLPFTILCDTERRAVREWGIYNSREKGGIAIPAVFVIDCKQVIRFVSVDAVAKRVPAAEIVSLLQGAAPAQPVPRRVHLPLFSDWVRAIRNSIQR